MISGSYPPMPCGVGDYTERLVSALRDDGVETLVLTSDPAQGAANGANGQVVPGVRTWHRKALHAFLDRIRQMQPAAVHIQFPTQGYDYLSGLVLVAAHARFRLRASVVVTLHEYLPRIARGISMNMYGLALLAHRIVVVRPEYHARIPLPGRFLIPQSKLQFVANASVLPTCSMTDEQRATVKREIGSGSAAVVAFFGFSFPHKGVDLLFEIADPERHHLLLIGDLSPSDAYHRRLLELASSTKWKGKATVTGFVDPARAARLMATADAVVFPYRTGGGIWNSSLHAAIRQDTFVLVASQERSGYDPDANVYYARPGDIEEMRKALLAHQGTRRARERSGPDPWRDIARAHREMYASLIRGDRARA